jgi:hypothetical protein
MQHALLSAAQLNLQHFMVKADLVNQTVPPS